MPGYCHDLCELPYSNGVRRNVHISPGQRIGELLAPKLLSLLTAWPEN